MERTSLAWSRTALSAAAAGALALHAYDSRRVFGALLAGLLFAVAAVASTSGGRAPASPARLLVVSVGVSAAAALATLLSLTGP